MQAMQLRCGRCHLGTAIALLICPPSQLSLETLAMMAKSTSLYFASNRHLAATLGVCNTLGVLAGGRIRSRRSRAGRSCRASSLDTAHTQPLECSEWLPSVSMDPNGLDISEESDMKVPSRCLRSCCTFSNMACCADYMPFPIAPQLHHHTLHMGQHQHPHNMPLLQAVTQMHHQPQSSLGGMQHASGLDFMTQHGPIDPHQHLQSL